MKNIFILLTLSIFLITARDTLSQGIDFKPVRIDEGIEMAQAQNKNLFVLIGTTHCPYSRQTFVKLLQDKTCDNFFEKHFISIAYGDSNAFNGRKWYESESRLRLNRIESELEAVLSYCFFFPVIFS